MAGPSGTTAPAVITQQSASTPPPYSDPNAPARQNGQQPKKQGLFDRLKSIFK
jgi:hypothetical protein